MNMEKILVFIFHTLAVFSCSDNVLICVFLTMICNDFALLFMLVKLTESLDIAKKKTFLFLCQQSNDMVSLQNGLIFSLFLMRHLILFELSRDTSSRRGQSVCSLVNIIHMGLGDSRVSFCQFLLDSWDSMTAMSLFWLSAGDFNTGWRGDDLIL